MRNKKITDQKRKEKEKKQHALDRQGVKDRKKSAAVARRAVVKKRAGRVADGRRAAFPTFGRRSDVENDNVTSTPVTDSPASTDAPETQAARRGCLPGLFGSIFRY